MRRPVAWLVAVVLFVEAFGIAALNWFLGVVVDRQDMSLAGLDPDMMSVSSKVGGLVFGLYFAACALTALLVALRDRAPRVLGRVLVRDAKQHNEARADAADSFALDDNGRAQDALHDGAHRITLPPLAA